MGAEEDVWIQERSRNKAWIKLHNYEVCTVFFVLFRLSIFIRFFFVLV